jgi:hypothetical protein
VSFWSLQVVLNGDEHMYSGPYYDPILVKKFHVNTLLIARWRYYHQAEESTMNQSAHTYVIRSLVKIA